MNIVTSPECHGPCPQCGAHRGAVDPDLKYPNPLGADGWWRCLNPTCAVDLYGDLTEQLLVRGARSQAFRRMAA